MGKSPENHKPKTEINQKICDLLNLPFDRKGDTNGRNDIFEGVFRLVTDDNKYIPEKLKKALLDGLKPDFENIYPLARSLEQCKTWHVPSRDEAEAHFTELYRNAEFMIFPIQQIIFVKNDRFECEKARSPGYIAFVKPEDKKLAQEYWDIKGIDWESKKHLQKVKNDVQALLEGQLKSGQEILIARWHNSIKYMNDILSPEQRSIFYTYGLDLISLLNPNNPWGGYPNLNKLSNGKTIVSYTYYHTIQPGVYWITKQQWIHNDPVYKNAEIEWILVRFNEKDEQLFKARFY
jgi:hypothetical protein